MLLSIGSFNKSPVMLLVTCFFPPFIPHSAFLSTVFCFHSSSLWSNLCMYSKGTLFYAYFGKQSVSGLLIGNPVHMQQVQGEIVVVCEMEIQLCISLWHSPHICCTPRNLPYMLDWDFFILFIY